MPSADRPAERLRAEPLVRQPHPHAAARRRARHARSPTTASAASRRTRRSSRRRSPRGEGYDEQLAELARGGRPSRRQRTGRSSSTTSAHAADLLRPVYDSTGGADGFVSIEVSPDLAHDTDAHASTQAAELFGRLGRPNVMIKIPATLEGLPAITQTIAAGINVNVTLIFSLGRHDAVIDAYLDGSRAARGVGRRPVDGVIGGVVLREPGRHRDRPAPPRRPPAARARPRSRTRSSRTSCSERVLRRRGGRRSRRRAHGCSGRCGRRRRRRTRRTPPRSTSTSSSGATPSTRSRRRRSTRCTATHGEPAGRHGPRRRRRGRAP